MPESPDLAVVEAKPMPKRGREKVGIWAFGANRKIDSLENILPPGPEGALDARFSKTVAQHLAQGMG